MEWLQSFLETQIIGLSHKVKEEIPEHIIESITNQRSKKTCRPKK